MRKIPLTSGLYALVDDEDFPILMQVRWRPVADKRGKTYAKNEKLGYMHRLIMRPGDGEIVDHRDGNGLNNQRDNLRLATTLQNNQNVSKRAAPTKSKHKGLAHHAGRRKAWQAIISINGKRKSLGYFETEDEAACAYNEAAAREFGDFARLNEVESK